MRSHFTCRGLEYLGKLVKKRHSGSAVLFVGGDDIVLAIVLYGWVGGFVNRIYGWFSLFDRVWVGWTTFEFIDGFGVGSSSVVGGVVVGGLVKRLVETIFNYSFTLLRTEW